MNHNIDLRSYHAGIAVKQWVKSLVSNKKDAGRLKSEVGKSKVASEDDKPQSKTWRKMEKKWVWTEERKSREGKAALLIDQTCRQPDSQGDVCPCAATLWPADT